MDESLCPYRTHGQKNKWKYFHRLSRTRMVLNRCFGQMWLAFFCLCFASPQTHHHHFLQSWLIPDGSCSSGRACWPCVAHQSWVFFFYAAFNFISTRVRGEIFFFCQGTCERMWCFWPPCGWRTSFAETSAAPSSWRCALEKPWLQITLHHRPRAKVGGCVKAPGALIFSAVHRLPFCQDGALSLPLHALVSARSNGENPVCHVCLPVFLAATTPRCLFLCKPA